MAARYDPSSPPVAQGLYDPATERDACGVGFVVHMKGRRSHDIVRKALRVLINLEHRGACGCEANTGDGAGILIQMPDTFLRKVAPVDLPAARTYGAGLVFLPRDARDRNAIMKMIARVVEEEGQTLLGWRDVPSDMACLATAPRPHSRYFSTSSSVRTASRALRSSGSCTSSASGSSAQWTVST
jgi:glutamate synthase domain-containing protein 1